MFSGRTVLNVLLIVITEQIGKDKDKKCIAHKLSSVCEYKYISFSDELINNYKSSFLQRILQLSNLNFSLNFVDLNVHQV